MVNMDKAELRAKEQEISNSDLTSLSSLVVTEGETAIELVDTLKADDSSTDPEYMAGWDEAKDKFRSAFDRLPARERQVAVLLYVKHLTLREIGDVLRVSESRVSQIHSQLKRRLKEILESEEILFSEVA